MEKRKIGSLDVSVVGLGTNNFGARLDERGTAEVLDAIIDNGINFIDTADMYGKTESERFIGDLLGRRREDLIIATKFGHPSVSGDGWPDYMRAPNGSPEYVRLAVEGSLARLKTEYIDLYILHRPDTKVGIATSLHAMQELVVEGKVREIGCSAFTMEQLLEAEAAKGSGPGFVNLKNEFSLLVRDPMEEILEECVRQGIGFVPYSPLLGGLLSGKYRRGAAIPEGTRIAMQPEERRQDTLSDARLVLVERLISFAEARDHTMLELAFSWLLAQRSVASVIAGASNRAQVEANAAAASWVLTDEELAEVASILA